MCLAVPGKIIKIENEFAQVNFQGVIKKINIQLVPDIKKGEYCLVHAGFAIEKIDRKYAKEAQSYLEELYGKNNT